MTGIVPAEVEFQPIRASGPGGQHVNKVESAVQLRFDVQASSLPEVVKQRLLALSDKRLNQDGVLVLKAQRYRSQALNRQDALQRLQALVDKAARRPARRIATKATRASVQRRLHGKKQRSELKRQRGKVPGGGD